MMPAAAAPNTPAPHARQSMGPSGSWAWPSWPMTSPWPWAPASHVRGRLRIVRGLGTRHGSFLQLVQLWGCVGYSVGGHARSGYIVSSQHITSAVRACGDRPCPVGDVRRVRIWTGWGILVGLMARINALPGLLMAVVALPFVAGCAVLGLPPTGVAVDALPAADVEGGVATPGAEASPTFFSSNDGYALTLPAGWVGVKTNGNASDERSICCPTRMPRSADRGTRILDESGARMSMMGARAPRSRTRTSCRPVSPSS